VKIVHKQPDKPKDDELLRQEVSILRSLDHPNIVKCYDFYEDDKDFYVVMEKLDGGEVFDKLTQKNYYNEFEARELILVLLNAIKYCHDRGIVHRDLKCANKFATNISIR
jgi:serine/threonine protein kinase